MLGYFHTAQYARKTDSKEKQSFLYKMNTPFNRRRFDYLQGYTAHKKNITIETIDDIEIYEDWVVWLEGQERHMRVVSIAREKLSELREELFTILELE